MVVDTTYSNFVETTAKQEHRTCELCKRPIGPLSVNPTNRCLLRCKNSRVEIQPFVISPGVIHDIFPPVYFPKKPLPGITAIDIKDAVAKVMDVPMDVFNAKRSDGGDSTKARYLLAVLARHDLGFSLKQSAVIFGMISTSMITEATIWFHERRMDMDVRRMIHLVREEYPEKALEALEKEFGNSE